MMKDVNASETYGSALRKKKFQYLRTSCRK
jgi:hypothetical protein